MYSQAASTDIISSSFCSVSCGRWSIWYMTLELLLLMSITDRSYHNRFWWWLEFKEKQRNNDSDVLDAGSSKVYASYMKSVNVMRSGGVMKRDPESLFAGRIKPRRVCKVSVTGIVRHLGLRRQIWRLQLPPTHCAWTFFCDLEHPRRPPDARISLPRSWQRLFMLLAGSKRLCHRSLVARRPSSESKRK